MANIKRVFAVTFIAACFVVHAVSEPIDWRLTAMAELVLAIEQVESGGNPLAVGKAGERGSCQIMERTWSEVMPEYAWDRAFERDLSREACRRYLVKIGGWLKHYKLPVTTEYLCFGYNAGIGNVRNGKIPQSTREYVRRVKGIVEPGTI